MDFFGFFTCFHRGAIGNFYFAKCNCNPMAHMLSGFIPLVDWSTAVSSSFVCFFCVLKKDNK